MMVGVAHPQPLPDDPHGSELRTEVDGRLLTLTNLQRPVYPDGFTKAEVVDHYLRVAPVMLPHVEQRCLTRMRFPEGTMRDGFYQKNLPAGAPEWVATQLVRPADSVVRYPLADSAATLVWLANLSALEIHTPQWRLDQQGPLDPEVPLELDAEPGAVVDRLVVDLDPGPGTTMHDSCRAAMIVATELATRGLVPFVKTSGSKGLQLVAPLEPTPWRLVADWARGLAELLAQRHRDVFVAVMTKQLRDQRIYVDHLQNRADRNTIAPYSLRGREVPTASTPVTWDEVAAVGPDDQLRFTSSQLLARLEEHGDLWQDLLDGTLAAPLPPRP